MAEKIPKTTNEDQAEAELEARFTSAHYAAIGRVAAAWALFEGGIDYWAVEHAQIPLEVAVCFTAQIMGASRKLDAYIALVRYLGASESHLSQLNKIASMTYDYGDRRNRIVHDPWSLDDVRNPVRLEATARKRLFVRAVPVSTGEIFKTAHAIERLADQFWLLAQEIHAAVRPSRDISPPDAQASENTGHSPDNSIQERPVPPEPFRA